MTEWSPLRFTVYRSEYYKAKASVSNKMILFLIFRSVFRSHMKCVSFELRLCFILFCIKSEQYKCSVCRNVPEAVPFAFQGCLLTTSTAGRSSMWAGAGAVAGISVHVTYTLVSAVSCPAPDKGPIHNASLYPFQWISNYAMHKAGYLELAI